MGSEIHVDPGHYDFSYDSKARFCSYWHQIKEIISTNPSNILEIGPGTGFVSEYLKKHGYDVVTLDIDKHLKPDVVGSVISLPFKENSFDVLACFEVLEHIKFENVNISLKELRRISRRFVILSLPDIGRVASIRVPIIGKILLPFPRIKKQEHEFDGQHYWEINKKDYSLGKIIGLIKESGFVIKNTYRVFENPYHRILVLERWPDRFRTKL